MEQQGERPLTEAVEAEPPERTADYESLKHSGLGIASFAASAVICNLTFLLLFITAVLGTTPLRNRDAFWDAGEVFFVFLFGSNLMALGLGIAGAKQKDRKRVLAILGIILSAVLALFLALVVIGGQLYG